MNNLVKKASKTIFGLVLVGLIFLPVRTALAAYSAGTLVSLTNSLRSQNGLGALSTSPELSSAAYAKAQDMFNYQYFAHTSPQGKTPWDFIRGAGYEYNYAGENLAIGYSDANELMGAWMASQTHRENILNSNFREIGLAVLSGEFEGTETTIVVQEFGSPQEQTLAQEVASEENSSPSETETLNQNTQPALEIIKDKSNFTPQVIFAGEEVTFKVTLSGKPSTLEILVFGNKLNLLETATVQEADGQNIYTLKHKIDQEGSSEVVIKAQDKNGAVNQQSLGILEVKQTIIAKNLNENQTGFWGGIREAGGRHWLIFLLGFGGIGLVVAGYFILRRYKFNRLLPSWRF